MKPAYLTIRAVVLRALVRPGPPPVVPQTIRSLLVISERRLGDVCLAIPLLRFLRATYPHAILSIVLPRQLEPLVRWACAPNHILNYPEARQIQDANYDVVIDLTTDYHLKPARLAAATGAPVRIGFEFKGRERYFNAPVNFSEFEHMQDSYARTLTPLGISFRPIPLPQTIPGHGVSKWKHSVAVHPGAHHPTQRWPEAYFAELIRRIQDAGETCLVLGTEQESELVRRIVDAAGHGATFAITKDVLTLAAAIRSSSILICNNSGPLHLAGLLGVPTLSFMGPTKKQRWWPLASPSVVLRRDNLECIGCNLGYCRIRTHACMVEITPDEAFGAYCRLRAALQSESSR